MSGTEAVRRETAIEHLRVAEATTTLREDQIPLALVEDSKLKAPPQHVRPMNKAVVAIALGVSSVTFYLLLYLYSDTLVDWASLTRHGHKIYALIPIAVALAFSAVHGAFTGRFWDLLGLKARGK